MPQVVESQTHPPDTQCNPVPHWAWVPQRQLPVSQLSAPPALQLVHAAAPEPHWEVETAVTQLPF